MTLPRQILPGKTYLVTRRTTQRQFLLKPSKTVNAISLFCIAYAAHLYKIQIHAYCVMSSHYHLILTDPEAKLPQFEQWLNLSIAKNINVMLRRKENLWVPGSYSAVRIEVSPEDILDKMVYTLTNPVAAGLVKYGYQWPGLWSSPQSIGRRASQVRCPQVFFQVDGVIPREVAFKLVPPPGFSHLSVEEFRTQLAEKVREKEKEIHYKFETEGRTFMGVRKVMAQSRFDRPRSPEPTQQLSPKIACRDKWKRIEVLGYLKTFLSDYREAWNLFCQGVRDVIFPAGTYKMRVVYDVKCHSPP